MTVEETVVENEISNLDLTKVGALQQKRTLAFVNHFVITTVQFLNNFMRNCEMKLMNFERRLENVNANVVLLEDRLSSIPEVNKLVVEAEPVTQSTEKNTDLPTVEPSCTADAEETNEEQEVEATEEIEQKPPEVSPEYARFVKMVHVGVPLQAVKLKVAIEGLDPDVLESIVK